MYIIFVVFIVYFYSLGTSQANFKLVVLIDCPAAGYFPCFPGWLLVESRYSCGGIIFRFFIALLAISDVCTFNGAIVSLRPCGLISMGKTFILMWV